MPPASILQQGIRIDRTAAATTIPTRSAEDAAGGTAASAGVSPRMPVAMPPRPAAVAAPHPRHVRSQPGQLRSAATASRCAAPSPSARIARSRSPSEPTASNSTLWLWRSSTVPSMRMNSAGNMYLRRTASSCAPAGGSCGTRAARGMTTSMRPGSIRQPLRQLLAGIAVDRNQTAGGAQRTTVEPQQHQPLGQRIEMRVAQKIEVVDGHHAGYPPQQRQGQPGAEAVVEVELLITRPVNDILVLGGIFGQKFGKVLGVSPGRRGPGVSSNPIFITLCKIFRPYGK